MFLLLEEDLKQACLSLACTLVVGVAAKLVEQVEASIAKLVAVLGIVDLRFATAMAIERIVARSAIAAVDTGPEGMFQLEGKLPTKEGEQLEQARAEVQVSGLFPVTRLVHFGLDSGFVEQWELGLSAVDTDLLLLVVGNLVLQLEFVQSFALVGKQPDGDGQIEDQS